MIVSSKALMLILHAFQRGAQYGTSLSAGFLQSSSKKSLLDDSPFGRGRTHLWCRQIAKAKTTNLPQAAVLYMLKGPQEGKRVISGGR
jgi:hypothetical protein